MEETLETGTSNRRHVNLPMSKAPFAKTRIVSDWHDHYRELINSHSILLKHNLHFSELFQDDVLSELLEKSPSSHIRVVAGSDVSPVNPEIRPTELPAQPSSSYGTIGHLRGPHILQAIRNGKLSIQIKQPQASIPAFGALLEIISNDFHQILSQGRINHKLLKIQISSPGLVFPYRFNTAGRVLWQLRGSRKLHLYPAHTPFIESKVVEEGLLGKRQNNQLVYEPWFEQFAEVHELARGEMLHWPFNQPYRIENDDNLNVSLVTELWSENERKLYHVSLANAMLRKTGFKKLSEQTSGVGYKGKRAMALSHHLSRKFLRANPLAKSETKPIDFIVSPNAPNGMHSLNRVKIGQTTAENET